MKIILLKNVNNLGECGDVVTVKPGYARNFLFRNKNAVIYTKNNFCFIERKKIYFGKQNKELLKLDLLKYEKMSCLNLFFDVRSTSDGKLYGSVTNIDIMFEMMELGHVVSLNEILLYHSIKEIGEYDIKIKLKYCGKIFSIKLIIKSS